MYEFKEYLNDLLQLCDLVLGSPVRSRELNSVIITDAFQVKIFCNSKSPSPSILK